MVATQFDVPQRLPSVIHMAQILGTSCRCCLSEFSVVAGEFRLKGFKVEIMCGNMFQTMCVCVYNLHLYFIV